ncbi:chloromuconate cycloisomerase [Flavobacterium sp. J49]|uniref:enolase C-terminal domain-like protein n=1 Tax=Flavobacterium sp. J49 TaxID=2718534 RepID=UPI001592BBA8|nr:enolase C-terminal domain-like protein [Flavobacterium sp. J49]MBF6642032.1 chloromuconate cycloisomerase [Flavobacterium sp. J49]NIC03280.1 chloromuconate cycloisomerase [Flavobacterium sp. J49]
MVLSWQIVKFNLKETFAIAYGNYTFREALIVTLQSHGEKGYGECTSIDYYDINLGDFEQLLAKVKTQIESQKTIHPTGFYAFLLSLNLPSFLRSALDCAYWDLFGKLERQSFLQLNQIHDHQLPESSITISVDSAENQIKKINQSAWSKFKVKCNHFSESDITQLLQLNKNIALDSNGSFTAEECLWLENNQKVSEFTYLEQPMKIGVEHYSHLHADQFANWMADEDCQDITVLNDLVPHYKSINIKLVKCGGLTPALEMISKARALGFNIMIGCMTESTIGISAGAVLAPWCDYADLDGANLIANDIAKGSQIVNGKIHLSENHGLGIRIH